MDVIIGRVCLFCDAMAGQAGACVHHKRTDECCGRYVCRDTTHRVCPLPISVRVCARMRVCLRVSLRPSVQLL